jgi:hypothetical protein
MHQSTPRREHSPSSRLPPLQHWYLHKSNTDAVSLRHVPSSVVPAQAETQRCSDSVRLSGFSPKSQNRLRPPPVASVSGASLDSRLRGNDSGMRDVWYLCRYLRTYRRKEYRSVRVLAATSTFAHQCAINTGTGVDVSTFAVAPPSIISRKRECP